MTLIRDSRPHEAMQREEASPTFVGYGARGWLSLFTIAVLAFWFVAGI